MTTETPAPFAPELGNLTITEILAFPTTALTLDQRLYREGYESGRSMAGRYFAPSDAPADRAWAAGYADAWRHHRRAAGFSPGAGTNPEISATDCELIQRLYPTELDGLDELDALVRHHTAARTFLELAVDPGGSPTYRPSLYGRATRPIADAYNRFQSAKGDSRRAYWNP